MYILTHDYETTGVDVTTCGVVQSAVALVFFHPNGDYDIVQSRTDLFNPGHSIPAGASEVHGIYDKDIAGQPYYKDALPLVYELMSDGYQVEGIGGYNSNGYDNRISRLAGVTLPTREIDFMILANRLMSRGLLDRARLVDAYEGLTGMPPMNAHDAMGDVIMTLELVKPAMAKLGLSTVQELFSWLEKPEIDVNMPMPFGKHKGVALSRVPRSYLSWLNNKDLMPDLKYSIRAVLRS